MSNPNLFTVWSPDGTEMIETSRANARDLVTHAGWLSSPPTVIEKIVVVEKDAETAPVETPAAETPAEEAPAAETEANDETEEDSEEEAGEGDEDEGSEDEGSSENAPAVRKTEEDFADLTEREDVVAYLAATFPDFKPHHLSKRDGLVAKAIELANA